MFVQSAAALAPRKVFAWRLVRAIVFAGALILIVLLVGISGYHWIAGLSWIDALLNASMILGGMGPVDILTTQGAKLFASFYALFSGLVAVGATGLVLSPILHRMLHKFHIDDTDLSSGK